MVPPPVAAVPLTVRAPPVGAVVSLVKVRVVAVLVLPALSVLVTASVGEAVSAAGQAKLLVVT